MSYCSHSSFGPSRTIGKLVSKADRFLRQETFFQWGKYPAAISLVSLPLRQYVPGFLWPYVLFEIYLVAFAGFFLIRLMPPPQLKLRKHSANGHNWSYAITAVLLFGVVASSYKFRTFHDFELGFLYFYMFGSWISSLLFLKKFGKRFLPSSSVDTPLPEHGA